MSFNSSRSEIDFITIPFTSPEISVSFHHLSESAVLIASSAWAGTSRLKPFILAKKSFVRFSCALLHCALLLLLQVDLEPHAARDEGKHAARDPGVGHRLVGALAQHLGFAPDVGMNRRGLTPGARDRLVLGLRRRAASGRTVLLPAELAGLAENQALRRLASRRGLPRRRRGTGGRGSRLCGRRGFGSRCGRRARCGRGELGAPLAERFCAGTGAHAVAGRDDAERTRVGAPGEPGSRGPCLSPTAPRVRPGRPGPAEAAAARLSRSARRSASHLGQRIRVDVTSVASVAGVKVALHFSQVAITKSLGANLSWTGGDQAGG